jgi:hypothetical protein
MCIKNGVPGETRDAATAEAVWGAPRLAVITGAQQQRLIRNVADKKDGEKNMRPILEKVIMLSLIQSALERKNQLRQAAMRTPQISRDICRSAVN